MDEEIARALLARIAEQNRELHELVLQLTQLPNPVPLEQMRKDEGE